MFKVLSLLAIIAVGFFVYKYFVTQNKALAENLSLGKAFLEENAKNAAVQITSSGLQYLVLNPGSGTEQPKANDRVKVHYHGSLINGVVFDSSVERGQPIEFALNQVIKGWTEGLQLMHVGEKTQLFIPSTLAYANRGVGKIAPGSTLVFEVELLAINP